MSRIQGARITLTGSTAVGRELAEKAGRHLKRIALELGGQGPLIILSDADVDYAVNAAAFGSFVHQGQVCMATRRIIVEKPIAGEFVEKFVKKASSLKVGNPLERDTIIGPLINQHQFNEVRKAWTAPFKTAPAFCAAASPKGSATILRCSPM